MSVLSLEDDNDNVSTIGPFTASGGEEYTWNVPGGEKLLVHLMKSCNDNNNLPNSVCKNDYTIPPLAHEGEEEDEEVEAALAASHEMPGNANHPPSDLRSRYFARKTNCRTFVNINSFPATATHSSYCC